MKSRPEREGAQQRMTAVRYLLFCLLLLAGFADVQTVSAQAYAGERWVRGHLAVAEMPITPCRDGSAAASMAVAAPSGHLPDLLPAEREGDAVADRPSCGVFGFPLARACGTPAARVIERRPGHGFSSRAPPISS